MKRILLCLLTLLLTAFILVPDASARRHGRRGRRSRSSRSSRRGRRNRSVDKLPSGADFFGKRKEVRGMTIEPSNRPGPSGYMFSTDYVQTLRSALNESLTK